MKIAISGTNGYIAQNLCLELKKLHHTIVPIERNMLYDEDKLTKRISNSEIVINLAGAPILQRWTTANKNEIYKSRIETTQNIINAINRIPDQKKPKVFISASAIGIYTNTQVNTEESESFSINFVGKVVKDWENTSVGITPAVRRVIFRIAPILGNEAQIIQKMWPLFKIGLGGKIGSGKQSFPFIHIRDVVNAILWSIQNEKVQGIYNLAAPEIISNKEFTKAMSKIIGLPALFSVPEFVLKLIYGEAASILLKSSVVYPERLIKSGFEFTYPDIQSVLSEIANNKK